MRKEADRLTNKTVENHARVRKWGLKSRGEFHSQPETPRSELITSDRWRPAPPVTLKLFKCIISSANLPVLYLDCAHLSMPGSTHLRTPSLTGTFHHLSCTCENNEARRLIRTAPSGPTGNEYIFPCMFIFKGNQQRKELWPRHLFWRV